MMNGFNDMILNMTDTTPEPKDYTGEDGLLHCGKCHKPKESYFPEGMHFWGRDRHLAECNCQRAEREKREAGKASRKHREKVEWLKRRGFTDPAMQGWTFENGNGKCPQMKHARVYVECWEQMKAGNHGLLLWGKAGTGRSYLVGCIANALMEQEVSVCMTNSQRYSMTLPPALRAGTNTFPVYAASRCSFLMILEWNGGRNTA